MLEVEMEAASRDLKLEKQRLEGARERIVLRYVPIVIRPRGFLFRVHEFFIFKSSKDFQP
jgi:hypothetical protein